MAASENTKSIWSWLVIILLAYIVLGALLFPEWWYKFFFGGYIFRIGFWLGGIRSFLYFLIFRNPSLLFLLGVLVVAVLILRRTSSTKNLTNLPKINIFKWNRSLFLLLGGILIALFIYFAPDQAENNTISNDQNTRDKETRIKKFSAPIDFLFLDEARVTNLYNQISPELQLTESSVEQGVEASRKIGGGAKDILSSERSRSESEKKTEQYKAKEVTVPLMTIEVLNYFNNKNSLAEFETLELSSEEIRRLDDFNKVSQSYGIQYDKTRYDSVYTDIIKRTVIEQQEKLKNLNSQVLIRGKFSIENTSNGIVLSHPYFDKNNVKILFTLDPIAENSPSIKSSSFRSRDKSGNTITVTAFAKVVRIEPKGDELSIRFEPYAIW